MSLANKGEVSPQFVEEPKHDELDLLEEGVLGQYTRKPSQNGVYLRKDNKTSESKKSVFMDGKWCGEAPLIFFDIYGVNSELQHCKDDYFRYMPEISFTDDESQERNIASLYNTIDFYDPEFKRFRSVISIPPFALAHVSQEFYETEQKIWYLNSFALRHGYVFDGHMFSLVKGNTDFKQSQEKLNKQVTVRSGEIYEKIIHNTYTSIVPAMISKESEGTVTEQDMQVLDELFQDFFKKYPNGTINDFEIRLPQELEKDGKKKYYLFGIFRSLLNTDTWEKGSSLLDSRPYSFLVKPELGKICEIVLNCTLEPNVLLKGCYQIFGIDYDRMGVDNQGSKNSFIQNLLKGLLDECFQIQTLIDYIMDDFWGFLAALKKALINIGDTLEALLKQYTQFLTIESLSDPRDQYVLGQQLTQLVLTFLPVGVATKAAKALGASAKATKASLLTMKVGSRGLPSLNTWESI